MKKLLLFFMESRLYKWLLKKVIPKIRFTTYYTKFPGRKYHVGYNFLRPGDIILTTDSKKLTTLLIGGKWSHAALCVSKDQIFEVAEMTHSDYTQSTFFDVCAESTRVCILRCPKWSKEYIRRVIDRCKTLKNATYDVQFELGIQSLYCSELIYHSDFMKTLSLNLEDLAGLGRKYISPDGIYNCPDLKIVWDSSLSSTFLR